MAQWDDKTGLLIVGHGTREREGVEGFLAIVAEVQRQATGALVEPSFLEFVRPRIGEGVRRLVDRGARRIVVTPVFMLAAGHVRGDIPAALAEALAEHPGVVSHQVPHLGCSPAIVDLSAKRVRQSLAGRPSVAREETALLLVGRGSHDRRATDEMAAFVELRRRQAPGWPVEHCFLAMAAPSLDEALPRLAASAAQRVVVQPHLLLPGVLTQRIAARIEWFRGNCPQKDWIVARTLGPDPLLAQAVLDGARPWLQARSALFQPAFRGTMNSTCCDGAAYGAGPPGFGPRLSSTIEG